MGHAWVNEDADSPEPLLSASTKYAVPDLRGGLGGTCPPPPPRRGCECPKKYNICYALYDIASIYTVMHTYMITDYPHNNSAERKGGHGGTDRAVSVARACK